MTKIKGAGIAIKGLGKALKSFQDKRIDAINRKVEKHRKRYGPSGGKAMTEHYIEEHGEITSTKAKNKKEYKAEQKAKQEAIEKNLPKELP